MQGLVYLADNMEILSRIPSGALTCSLIDPPYNSKILQKRKTISVTASEEGDRVGFQGKRYKTTVVGEKSYLDKFDDLMAFLRPRFEQVKRILSVQGSSYSFIDWREEHRLRFLLDEIFGEKNYLNSLVWAYHYGSYKRDRWPQKHDTIYYYAKQVGDHIFNVDEIERVPYMAPGMVTPEKAARGKIPSDVWFNTISCGSERVGYPTQKPLKIVRRMVQASTHKEDTVIDFFAGSGTTGAAALNLGRKFILIDNNPQAFDVMQRRFAGIPGIKFVNSKEEIPMVEADVQELLNGG